MQPMSSNPNDHIAIWAQDDQTMFDQAVKTAKDPTLTPGQRFQTIVMGARFARFAQGIPAHLIQSFNIDDLGRFNVTFAKEVVGRITPDPKDPEADKLKQIAFKFDKIVSGRVVQGQLYFDKGFEMITPWASAMINKMHRPPQVSEERPPYVITATPVGAAGVAKLAHAWWTGGKMQQTTAVNADYFSNKIKWE